MNEKRSLFYDGCRPLICWVMTLSLCWSAVLQPVLSFVMVVFFDYKGVIPKAELTDLVKTLAEILTSAT